MREGKAKEERETEGKGREEKVREGEKQREWKEGEVRKTR